MTPFTLTRRGEENEDEDEEGIPRGAHSSHKHACGAPLRAGLFSLALTLTRRSPFPCAPRGGVRLRSARGAQGFSPCLRATPGRGQLLGSQPFSSQLKTLPAGLPSFQALCFSGSWGRSQSLDFIFE